MYVCIYVCVCKQMGIQISISISVSRPASRIFNKQALVSLQQNSTAKEGGYTKAVIIEDG